MSDPDHLVIVCLLPLGHLPPTIVAVKTNFLEFNFSSNHLFSSTAVLTGSTAVRLRVFFFHEMSLNYVVFTLLCVELVIVLLMIAPLPSFVRGAIVRWISTSKMLATLAKPVGYSAIVVIAMWASTTSEMIKYRAQYTTIKLESTDLAQTLQVKGDLFRSERNFYLSGASCLLLLVIYRIYVQLKELNRLEATSEALKKQAEGAAAGYKALSQEKDELKAQLKTLRKDAAEGGKPAGDEAAAEGSEAATGGEEEEAELTRLKEQNKKLAAERAAAEKDVEVCE